MSIPHPNETLGLGEIIEPCCAIQMKPSPTAIALSFPCRIEKGESLILDWGRKRTGWVALTGSGAVEFSYASDLRIFDIYDSEFGQSPDFTGDRTPTYFATRSRGKLELGENPRPLHERSATLRYLRLTNKSGRAVTIKSARMKPSEFPAPPAGSFECSDADLNLVWRMGIDTVHLCTQPGDESNVPVFAPFGNYVQWDGCRRDREIWGGDLRSGSLAWYLNWADQSPIANSLYLVMGAQHIGCDEHGLFPGSGSSHLKYYEWAFWESANLWEYILHTGDPRMTHWASHAMPKFLGWCEKKFAEQPDRWIHTELSWMYSFTRRGILKVVPLPALQVVAAIAFGAMEKLFLHVGQEKNAQRAGALRADIGARFHDAFWDEGLKAYFFKPAEEGDVLRSDLATNSWAILADIVPENRRQTVLDTLRERHWRDVGSVNVAPPYDVVFAHNDVVWPYSSSYEALARFHAGDTEGAFEVMRRYGKACAALGHRTLFEMIYLDGSLPIQNKGNDTLSFCHAWSAQGSWALQRYLLGVAPVTPGWGEFEVSPLVSSLDWVKGDVVTPHGPIHAELENKGGILHGRISHPSAIKAARVGETAKKIEISAV